MMDTNSLDLLVGGLALLIAIGGLWMLFGGISAMENQDK